MNESNKPNDRLVRGEDGKYRWVCEISLWKNPTVFWLVWKILFFSFLGVFAFVFLIDLDGGYVDWQRLFDGAKIFCLLLIGMTAVTGLGYALYAAIMGGKYVVEFEMDEKGILHRQTASQAKKAKQLGRATMIAGAASGRIGTVGAGLAAQRTEMYSDFSRTKKVKAYRRRRLIKVNGVLSHNRVYAVTEDFDFVYDFIITHCPNLKKK
ncbi:MAG: hypothetical protein ACOYJY_07545 [Acutalibacteraceae bacterium]|jgi:hypothetical protein